MNPLLSDLADETAFHPIWRRAGYVAKISTTICTCGADPAETLLGIFAHETSPDGASRYTLVPHSNALPPTIPLGLLTKNRTITNVKICPACLPS